MITINYDFKKAQERHECTQTSDIQINEAEIELGFTEGKCSSLATFVQTL